MRSLYLLLLPHFLYGQLVTKTTTDNQSADGHSRLPALYVAQGTPPAPGLKPGKFTTTWTGEINLEKRSRLYFSFEGKGEARLRIQGEEILKLSGELNTEKSKRLRLNPGKIPFEITYTSNDDGSGEFRLYWEGRSFAREVIPPTAFTKIDTPLHSPAYLIATHQCMKCHQNSADLGPHAMPELKNEAPSLANIGSRRHEAWLARWIAQPEKLKPSTTMPAMVDHTKAEGAQAASDIAAYLATLKEETPPLQPQAGDAQQGGAIFHNLGCVACHTPPTESEHDREHRRIPLNNIAEKFQPGTLAPFLKKPTAHWKSSKMPDFRLSDKEAQDLSAFLRDQSTGKHTPDPSEFPTGNASRGEELVRSLNCASCHESLPRSSPQKKITSWDTLTKLPNWSEKGCLAEDEKRGDAPRLMLTEEEKKSLHQHAALHAQLRYDTPASYAQRQTTALRCAACHDHDGEASTLSLNHADTKPLVSHLKGHDEKFDQSRPPLTYFGAMLKTPYFEKMLNGTTSPRPRPWLEMRMPAFHAQAQTLPAGFAAQHGLPPSQPDTTPLDPEQVKLGEKLVGMTGYACVTCHGVGDVKPLAAFEVQGINFAECNQRLRPGYYHHWMQNPSRLIPGTKMPKYTNEDGTALRNDLLEGDSKKQFEAIWQYLRSLDPSVEAKP